MTFLSMPAPKVPMLKRPELRMNPTYDFLENASPWGSHVEDESYLWLSWACGLLKILCWITQDESYLWLSWACQPLRFPCWITQDESYLWLSWACRTLRIPCWGWILPMTFLSMPAPEDPMLDHLGWILPMTFLSMPAPEDPMLNHPGWGWILPMTFLSMPAPEDPMLNRPELRMFIATLNPPPTSPMTFSTGTGVLSKNTSHAKINTNITLWRNITG